MKPDSSKILDDLARVAGSAINIVSGLQQQVRGDMKSRLDEWATQMDLVPREDFERLEAMVKSLYDRIEALEGKNPDQKQKKTTSKKKKAA